MSKLTASQNLVVEVGETNSKATLGFWIYLMTDCVLFATLFATYAVQHTATFGGESGQQLFSLPFVLLETMVLLTSSFSAGIAMLNVRRSSKFDAMFWFTITATLGLLFVCLEFSEFHKLIAEGNSFRRSGFLSSYFTLVATHGLHIVSGLLWLSVLMVRTWKHGLSTKTVRGWTLFSLFWHFLDVVWIFIFTIVYLFGAIGV